MATSLSLQLTLRHIHTVISGICSIESILPSSILHNCIQFLWRGERGDRFDAILVADAGVLKGDTSPPAVLISLCIASGLKQASVRDQCAYLPFSPIWL